VRYRNDSAVANFYAEDKNRISLSAAAGRVVNISSQSKLHLQASTDWVDRTKCLPSLYVGFEYSNLKIYYAKSNNLPGFNDLFWPSGGNQDLKPEYSDRVQLSYDYAWREIRFKSAIYASVINDWILWSPGVNGLWTPENQKRVFSRGVEIALEKEWPINKWIITPSLEYSLNNTTVADHYINPLLKGKSLIFVPQHQLTSGVKVRLHKHLINLTYQITSERFADLQNTDALPSIQIFHLDYSFMGFRDWRISFRIENLFDHSYEISRFFPMPLRNFTIGIQYFIHNHKN
jgi:iron complex outermembrane receptor protein